MLVYEGIKQSFLDDVTNDSIVEKIKNKFKEKYLPARQKSEEDSWKNSLEYMYKVLNDNEIPNNAGVAIEFNIPATNYRIDFTLSGYDDYNKKNVLIIELKQWEKCNKIEEMDGMVSTYLRGSDRITKHPSYQAWSYTNFIKDFNMAVQKDLLDLYPCAYLHNYQLKENDPLTDKHYEAYLIEAPVFCFGDVIKFKEFIKRYISKGNNGDLLYTLENGEIKPSKRLQDTLSKMLAGNKEFILLDIFYPNINDDIKFLSDKIDGDQNSFVKISKLFKVRINEID